MQTYDEQKRQLLILLQQEGISNKAVLQALAETPREFFVSESSTENAYWNTALPIGWGQTISQPLIVAHRSFRPRMTPASVNIFPDS